MKIRTVGLRNYRAHKSLSVDFEPGFNLIVGVNGSGKTSLLKGVCEALTGGFSRGLPKLRLNFPLSDVDSTFLRAESINGRFRFEPSYPVTISSKACAFDTECEWELVKNGQLDSVERNGFTPLDAMKQVRNNLNFEAEFHSDFALPLIAFYRANRHWDGPSPSEMQAATERLSRMDAYASWADASADSSGFQGWVIAKCLERFQTSAETGQPFDQIDDDELALVSGALSKAVEGFKGMKYDLKQKSILIEWHLPDAEECISVTFGNLSDGQRAVICLVADIARRICLLNPVLGNEVIERTAGVVLIDELDVHLHPRWQRILTTGLKRAFPSLQFIAASHSPQVIGELKPKEIILLKQGETTHPRVSYGLDSSQVLEEIMGAGSRSVDVEKRLGTLFESLERNQFDLAKSQIESLRDDVKDIPELAGAEALLRRKQVLGR